MWAPRWPRGDAKEAQCRFRGDDTVSPSGSHTGLHKGRSGFLRSGAVLCDFIASGPERDRQCFQCDQSVAAGRPGSAALETRSGRGGGVGGVQTLGDPPWPR